MEKIALLLPFILMIVVVYFIYKYLKNKKSQPKNIEDQNNEELWKKARWGLYFIIPFIAVFDIINNDTTGGNQNLLPTILNFFITRYLIKNIIQRGFNISFPKLATAGVSIMIFIIQVGLGRVITI